MPNALFASESIAHYDFLDGYVSLPRWNAPVHERLEAALALPEGEHPSDQMREDRALLMHEITHFLDATTTAWGLELAWRKILAVKRIRDNDVEAQEAAGVLMLNLSEVGAHHAFLHDPLVESLGEDLEVVHRLVHDTKFGVIILIHFRENGDIVHTVPLSMLSLLEAHAYANETLLCIGDARRNPDSGVAAVDYTLIIQKLARSLADPELSEYTVLIRLVRLHFGALDVEQQLELVVALARFCLDVDSLSMSKMANCLGFANNYLGNALSMDLRRGASRAVLFMKTVFGLHSVIESNSGPSVMHLLKCDPRTAIKQFWEQRIGILSDISHEYEIMMDRMPKDSGMLDDYVFSMSSRHNRALLERTSAGRVPFAQFLLLDSLLGDLTPVCPPNRIDINVETAVEKNLEVLGRLQSLCVNDKAGKFHMTPEQAQSFYVNLLQQMQQFDV